ncbi:hypothetical protein KS4_11290 [Poriferisphaera corsica]|uniref:Uncharacterized protein n=1 Tax=Poriferisphaera corsica TaxID=2528020 RepID=A0A517YS72_9BACT|nr:hypothetical protein [Poriferisphaera corsica]QDU33087.1 hypothetical protein KS4_11290 [Poriferisphaera corsica]
MTGEELLLMILMGVTVVGGVIVGVLSLLTGSWKGRMVWSSPRCGGRRGRCGYDLRGYETYKEKRCPECGTDLNDPKVVEFVKRKMNWWLLFGAVIALTGPVAWWGGIGVVLYGKANGPQGWNLGRYPLEVVEAYLQEHMEPGAAWSVMEVCKGALVDQTSGEEDVARAFRVMGMCLNDEKMADRLDHQTDPFVAAAIGNDRVTDEMMVGFYRDWFGRNARAALNQRVYVDDERVRVDVRTTPHLHASDGLQNNEVVHQMHVKGVRLDGEDVKYEYSQDGQRRGVRLWLTGSAMKEGNYAVEVDIERVLFDKSLMPEQGHCTREDWPKEVVWREEKTLRLNMPVYEDVADAIEFVEDRGLEADLDEQVRVMDCMARTFNGKTRLILILEREREVVNQLYELEQEMGVLPERDKRELIADPVVVNLQAEVEIDGVKYELLGNHQQDVYGERRKRVRMKSILKLDLDDELDPEVRELDFILSGNREQLKENLEVDEVWQGRVERKNVRVKRWDLGEDLEAWQKNMGGKK